MAQDQAGPFSQGSFARVSITGLKGELLFSKGSSADFRAFNLNLSVTLFPRFYGYDYFSLEASYLYHHGMAQLPKSSALIFGLGQSTTAVLAENSSKRLLRGKTLIGNSLLIGMGNRAFLATQAFNEGASARWYYQIMADYLLWASGLGKLEAKDEDGIGGRFQLGRLKKITTPIGPAILDLSGEIMVRDQSFLGSNEVLGETVSGEVRQQTLGVTLGAKVIYDF